MFKSGGRQPVGCWWVRDNVMSVACHKVLIQKCHDITYLANIDSLVPGSPHKILVALNMFNVISMSQCKRDVTPVHQQWCPVSFALTQAIAILVTFGIGHWYAILASPFLPPSWFLPSVPAEVINSSLGFHVGCMPSVDYFHVKAQIPCGIF